MKQYNIHEAKTKFSSIVEQAMNGEDVIIAKSGKPMLKLVPIAKLKQPREPGGYEKEVLIPDDFNETSKELIDMFEGKE